ncbi:MAG: dipeptidase [Pirellulales bacterium]
MKRFSSCRSACALAALVLLSLPPGRLVLAADDATAAAEATIVVSDRAQKIHDAALLIDGHNDLPWVIRTAGSSNFEKIDIAQPQPKMHTDIPRLRAGGVKAQFWSVYVPAGTRHDGKALSTTLEQITIVKSMIERYPDVFELALTVDDIQRISGQGKIASMIGVEGGHSIENSIAVLRQLYAEGARYMTLTHSDTLDWADSATDQERNGGLSPFGQEVVREMNRLGMLVDISHVSIPTMKQAIEISQAPVIFSHSSARAIADHPRNVPDDVLKLTADNGGVVMVNFYPGFVVPAAAERGKKAIPLLRELKNKYGNDTDKIRAAMRNWAIQNPTDPGSIHVVLDHIDHIAKTAGVDHVGIGSDYDGIESVPRQLEDVSTYPRITQGLLDRGYSEPDIHKILGGNLLRVMRAAEATAQRLEVAGKKN